MTFYNQKEIIFYNRAMMWFLPVRERQKKRGEIFISGRGEGETSIKSVLCCQHQREIFHVFL